MSVPTPINIQKFIADNAESLQPPVGGKPVWTDTGDFIVVMLGGNDRTDWHVNPTEEFFYQIEGDITLKIREDGRSRDLPIRAGEVFLLPPNVPHSPQRPAGTKGLVIERYRGAGQADQLQWYCQQCDELVRGVEGEIHGNLVGFINDATAEYVGDEQKRTCPSCGHVNPAK